MKTDELKQLGGLQCPGFFDEENFEKARACLIRVRSGKVSASMSGIEYYPGEVSWMLGKVKTV